MLVFILQNYYFEEESSSNCDFQVGKSIVVQ